MGFVVDEMEMGQAFLPVQLPISIMILPVLHTLHSQSHKLVQQAHRHHSIDGLRVCEPGGNLCTWGLLFSTFWKINLKLSATLISSS